MLLPWTVIFQWFCRHLLNPNSHGQHKEITISSMTIFNWVINNSFPRILRIYWPKWIFAGFVVHALGYIYEHFNAYVEIDDCSCSYSIQLSTYILLLFAYVVSAWCDTKTSQRNMKMRIFSYHTHCRRTSYFLCAFSIANRFQCKIAINHWNWH